ncbi:hypothetical protein GCM10010402_14200 [Actinomadura luteofluorescens]|uniref:hypothetical protein n=1 Tax=Actinomadura luteofluorescens TaxID=46163 RepID=UPI00216410D4|nr:hypothetical protein [Actinomadura glauciflava]
MPTEYLEHGGTVYELLSYYALPDDAWSIELTDMGGEGGPLAHVLVPDEDMDRPCEVLALDASRIPAEVLRRLLVEVAESARHAGATFVRDQQDPPAGSTNDRPSRKQGRNERP